MVNLPTEQTDFQNAAVEAGAAKNAERQEDKVALKKDLNLFACITMIVGSTIGSGIFISPKGVLLYSGSVGVCLVVWTLGGVLAIFGALSFAELGTTFGKSGGDYTYVREAFGPQLAFLITWKTLVLESPATHALMSIAFATYVCEPLYPDCEPPKSVLSMIAVLTLYFIYFVNCWKVKAAASVQSIFTVAKVIGLLIIVVGGMVQLSRGKTKYLRGAFEETPDSAMDVSLAFFQAMFAYAGWETLNFITEELRNPIRDFPIAMVVSEIIIIFLYVMANIAYLTVLSPEQLLASNAVGVTFADHLLGSFAWTVPVFVGMSIFGAFNGSLLANSRVCFTSARDGHLPATMGMVHIYYRTPLVSLLALGMLAVIVFSISTFTGSTVTNLLTYLTFMNWFLKSFVTSALLYLRWKRPDLHRPFKVPIIIPIVFTLAILYLSITGIIAAPVETGIGFAIILTGVPAYYFGQWNKPPAFYKISAAVGNFIQKFLLVVSQEKKTY